MSKLEQLVGAARDDVQRRKQQVPIEDLRRMQSEEAVEAFGRP